MSIAKKVTLVVSLLCAALLAGTAYGLLVLRELEVREQVRAQAQLLARALKLSAESALETSQQLGAIQSLATGSAEMGITFYGLDGRAIAPAPREEAPVSSGRVLRVMERNQPEEELAGNAYAYRVPLVYRERVVGAMELNAMISAPTWPRAALLVGGGLLAFFALFVGLFSRRSIGRPIDQLMDGMDHVIRGDLTVALPLDRNDEIGRIAYRFNEMTAQLRDAQEEIHRSADAKLSLEQRLRQSEKLATIGQLSAEIAHEVGTPLNVIGGRARTLERKADQPAEVLKNSHIIADQADRITKIIQRMLDLSRARSPERKQLDLVRIIDDALSFLEYQIERSGVEVVRKTAQLPAVKGDADGLQQVFINLVVNAVQAMPSGGTLTIAAREERRRKVGLDLAPPQQYLAVEISDTGEGIPEEEHGKIFEPFYSTKRRGEGTGLGLTVVHGIVKDHDGWIEVERAQPRGTTFRVYLPTEEQPAARADNTMEL